MPFFNKDNDISQHSLRARVYCSEKCELRVGEHSPIPCRVREFNWLGFCIDKVDIEHKDVVQKTISEKTIADITLPRDFGRMEVHVESVVISEYLDVLSGSKKIMLTVSLHDEDKIDRIREFVNYRNRRFLRSKRSKVKNTFFTRHYVIMFLMAVSMLGMILLSLVRWFFNG